MADTRDKVGRAGVFLAGGVFKTAVYIFIIVFLIWVGKSAYQFGYDVFNQQAMSPGEGQQVTVVIKEGASAYKVGKTLELMLQTKKLPILLPWSVTVRKLPSQGVFFY